MIRTLRDPRPSTAARARFVAFLVAAFAVATMLAEGLSAAAGHADPTRAAAWAVVGAAVTLGMALIARSLDPLRRR